MKKFADESITEGVPKKTGGAPSGGEGGARGGRGQQQQGEHGYAASVAASELLHAPAAAREAGEG